MHFNINDYVKVQLTDYGRYVHKDDHYRFWATHRPFGPIPDYLPPTEDGNGWSKWQMWHLMDSFGSYMGLGRELPFKTEIEINV